MGVLLSICSIFSECLFVKTPIEGKICNKPWWCVLHEKLRFYNNKIILVLKFRLFIYTYRGLLLFPGKIILWKRHNRLIHLLSPKFSIPNSWYIFSRKESLIAPLFANVQLYWTRLVFSRFFYIRGNLGNAKDFYHSSRSLTEEIRLF